MTDDDRGFDVLSQRSHWDELTASVIDARLAPTRALRFFTEHEARTAYALAVQILGSHDGVPVTEHVDARLARGETDGWRHEDLPEDGEAFRTSLAQLDTDAGHAYGRTFADLSEPEARALIDDIASADATSWHGSSAAHVWSLWTRYVCAAFYAHPDAWSEIGFPGPAYPRGYGNLGLDKREPWEPA